MKQNPRPFVLFIDILCMSVEHKPYLCRLLKQNRGQGITNDDLLLWKEFELTVELADFENALEVISILYGRNPSNEMIFVNYIHALGRACPEKLPGLQEKVKHFEFTSPGAVKVVYSGYADNSYLEFATEFLVARQRSMDNDELKHFFYMQCTMGPIGSIVNKEYECAEEGLSVLYSFGEENNVVIVKSTTPLGKALIGKKKGDVINFDGQELHIEAICSKYYKESADYIKEVVRQGGNQYMLKMKFDMEHPLESLNAVLEKMNPDSVDYEKRKRDAIQQYENDKIGLWQLVDGSHIMGSYYKMLFSPFKVHVTPVERYINRCMEIRPDTKFVLDLPACIMLFEFAQKTGCKYNSRFQVSKYLYEFVKQTERQVRWDVSLDFFEGIKSGHIKRFDERLDVDCEIRLQALIEWMDDNCDVEVVTDALAVNKAGESQMNALFSNTMLSLKDTNNYLISDEGIYDSLFKGQLQIISTEAFVYRTEDEQLGRRYSEFLFECRFEGVCLEKDFIVTEYFKMENGKENRFSDVMLNGGRNLYLLVDLIDAGLVIAQSSLAVSLVKITLTNMFTMCLKNYHPSYFQSQEWQCIQMQLNHQSFCQRVVKECLNDAVMVCHSPKNLLGN